jgi:hypothetical protein
MYRCVVNVDKFMTISWSFCNMRLRVYKRLFNTIYNRFTCGIHMRSVKFVVSNLIRKNIVFLSNLTIYNLILTTVHYFQQFSYLLLLQNGIAVSLKKCLKSKSGGQIYCETNSIVTGVYLYTYIYIDKLKLTINFQKLFSQVIRNSVVSQLLEFGCALFVLLAYVNDSNFYLPETVQNFYIPSKNLYKNLDGISATTINLSSPRYYGYSLDYFFKILTTKCLFLIISNKFKKYIRNHFRLVLKKNLLII